MESYLRDPSEIKRIVLRANAPEYITYLLAEIEELKTVIDNPKAKLLFDYHNERTKKEEALRANGKLLSKIERKDEALRFYANEETYEETWVDDAEQWADPEIESDLGQRAREAL